MPNNRSSNDVTVNMAVAKYQIAIDKNISEGGILWSRYNALLVFNSLLITAIGFIYQDSSLKLPLGIVRLLPIAGLISCYFWRVTTFRGFQWISYWSICARRIEEEYLKDKFIELNPIMNGKEHRNQIIGWPSTRKASYLLIAIIAIFYVIFLLSFFGIVK